MDKVGNALVGGLAGDLQWFVSWNALAQLAFITESKRQRCPELGQATLDDVSSRDVSFISAVIYMDDVSSCSDSHGSLKHNTKSLMPHSRIQHPSNTITTSQHETSFLFRFIARKPKQKTHSEPELQLSASFEEEGKKRDSMRAQPIIWCVLKRSL